MNTAAKGRFLVYILCAIAGALSFAGLADFNWQTGDLDVYPLNIYELAGTLSGVIAGGMGALAIAKHWRTK